jgi:hypothetical protein
MAMSDLLKYFGTVGVNPFAARTATIPPEIEQQQAARQIKDITGIDVYKTPPPPMPEIDLLSLPQRRGEASLTPVIIGEEQGPPRPTSLMPQEIDIAGLPQRRERAPVAPVAPKRDSERLGLMLYALGGALRGDKDFVSKTIQLREMKEGKKKEAERKKNFDEFLKKLDPDSPFYDLAKAMGPQNLPQLLLERYKTGARETDPSKEIKKEERDVLMRLKELDGDVDKLSRYEKLVYENFLKKDSSQGILEQLGLISNITPNQAPSDLIIKEIQE